MPSAAILGVAGPDLRADEAAFLRDADPFGFILFARNVDTPAQLARLTADLRAAVGRDAPVLIDQEGGRVARMRAPYWREFLPPLDQATAAGAGAARSFWLRGRLIAADLAAVGIDVNCTPCCDIAGPATHPFLRNRCLGTDAAAVAAHARAWADGQMAGGVLPVVKHMPGHGRAVVDSHLALPVADEDAGTLDATDFAPFRQLSDLPMGMTAHVVYPALDDRPATLSPVMIEVIRTRIGFAGLLMTDDLSMQALAGDVGSRAGAAIAAGCDLALHCNGALPEMAAVVAAAGAMTPAACARAEAALACRRAPPLASGPVDIATLVAELSALLDPP
ncbi:MAG: beta-N-acetylhexosaminidase [Rhodobacteraceae bacterium]|nr:beta-N-acetylhexosaminidase [Paracoccaceae bacterium]